MRIEHSRAAILSLFLTFSLIAIDPAAIAMTSPIQGKSCPKAGAKNTQNSVSYTCTKSNSKLMWVIDRKQNPKPVLPQQLQLSSVIIAFTSKEGSQSVWTNERKGEVINWTKTAMEWWNRVTVGKYLFPELQTTAPYKSKVATTCDPTVAGKDALTHFGIKNFSTKSRIIVFALDNKCNFAGVAEMGGSKILINIAKLESFDWEQNDKANNSSAAIAHELGHTFGLQHSSALDCSAITTATKYSISKSCDLDTYGDNNDFMATVGNLDCKSENGKKIEMLSTTQRYLGLGQGNPLSIDKAGSYTVNDFSSKQDGSLYYLITEKGVLYIEFRSKYRSECIYRTSGSVNYFLDSGDKVNPDNLDGLFGALSQSGIEIRLVGNDQYYPIAKNHSNDIGYFILSKKRENYFGNADRESGNRITWVGNDALYEVDESLPLPNTNFRLTVTSVTDSSATFNIQAI